MSQPAAIHRYAPARALAGSCLIIAACLLAAPLMGQQPAAPDAAPTALPRASAENDDNQPPPPAGNATGRVQYVGPDTYILLDEDGRPQPMPGMTYEDFLAAWKQLQQAARTDRQPRYVIDRIHIDAVARDNRAELQFEATVRLLSDEPIDVPLGLSGAILRNDPQITNSDTPTEDEPAPSDTRHPTPDTYIFYDADRGFVARLTGRPGEQRTAMLELIVPLVRDGGETAIALATARATSSTMMLTIDAPIQEALTTSGAIINQEPTGDGGTRLHIAGAVGPLRVSWQTGDGGAAELATVLSATGAIRASIDGRSLRTTARLTVRSYGGSFDRFRVRLPPGAQLVRRTSAETLAESPSYRISIENEPAQNEGGLAERLPTQAGRRVVLVELPEKQQGPVTVELPTEQPIGLDGDGGAVDLTGFEVLGAIRQFGDLAVDVDDDWQPRWQLGPHVRQIDPSELDPSLQHPGLTAAFQYDRQPWTLSMQVATRQSRVHVTPRYELDLQDEAQLTVQLNYQIFGTRVFEFPIRMEGWEYAADWIESGGAVDQDRAFPTGDGTLILPLVQGTARRAEITLHLRRALPRTDSRIDLPLPVPVADSVGAGQLVVRTGADVELLPDLENKTLTPPTTPQPVVADPESAAPRLQPAVLVFRTLMPEPRIVAERIRRTREVTTAADIRVKIEGVERPVAAVIEQRVDYHVQFEPIKELNFDVPSELAADGAAVEFLLLSPTPRRAAEALPAHSTGVRLVAEPIDPLPEPAEPQTADSRQPAADSRQPLPHTDDPPAPSNTRRVRVALPQPQLGQFTVQVAYRVPANGVASPSTPWPLPLVRPVDGRASAVHAGIRTPRTLTAFLDTSGSNSSWKPADSESQRDGIGPSEFVADRPEASLPLVLSPAAGMALETTVERVWLQTWLARDVNNSLRQDRAVFRFRTRARQATVELPPQSPPEIEVLIDGRPADVLSREAGRIVVGLPPVAGGDAENAGEHAAVHTLELRSRRPVHDALVTRHRLTPPQIVGTAALAEVYWHIVLPGDQHIVRSPRRMTSASQWQWLGSFWGRRPVMTQAELERWSRASPQLAATAAQNEYLFTALAPAVSIELIAAPRWLIVLAASSAALALALVWIYVPQTQRGWVVVSVATVIAGLAVAYPAPALLIAQASVLGLIGAVIALVIARLAMRPRPWPVVLSAGSSQRQVTPRADALLAPSAVVTGGTLAAASTAPTASFRIPDQE